MPNILLTYDYLCMADPEPPTYEKALHQIRNTFSTSRLEAQGEYLRTHSGNYSRTQIDSLFDAIEQQQIKLNPEPTEYNCARIEEITVTYTPEGNAYSIRPESKTNPLRKYCTLAYEAGKRLGEYITDLEESGGGRVYDLTFTFQRPTATLEGLRAEEEELQTEHRIAEISPRPQEAEARVGIDVMDIFNRLSRQIEERFDELQKQIRSGASSGEIETLRQRIDDLERQRDRLQTEYREVLERTERQQRVRSEQETLTSKEYGVFRQTTRNISQD